MDSINSVYIVRSSIDGGNKNRMDYAKTYQKFNKQSSSKIEWTAANGEKGGGAGRSGRLVH